MDHQESVIAWRDATCLWYLCRSIITFISRIRRVFGVSIGIEPTTLMLAKAPLSLLVPRRGREFHRLQREERPRRIVWLLVLVN